MISWPVLCLFFLAVPIAANRKCWEDVNFSGYKHTDSKSKQTCDSGCDYCMKSYVTANGIESATWGCGCGGNYRGIEQCTSTGKFDRSVQGQYIELNCCKGNYCNSAENSRFTLTFLTSLFSVLSLYLLK